MAQARPLLGVPYIVANIRRSLNMNEIYRVRCVQIEFYIVKTLKQSGVASLFERGSGSQLKCEYWASTVITNLYCNVYICIGEVA